MYSTDNLIPTATQTGHRFRPMDLLGRIALNHWTLLPAYWSNLRGKGVVTFQLSRWSTNPWHHVAGLAPCLNSVPHGYKVHWDESILSATEKLNQTVHGWWIGVGGYRCRISPQSWIKNPNKYLYLYLWLGSERRRNSRDGTLQMEHSRWNTHDGTLQMEKDAWEGDIQEALGVMWQIAGWILADGLQFFIDDFTVTDSVGLCIDRKHGLATFSASQFGTANHRESIPVTSDLFI